jgi:hypothetical protein
VRRQAGRLAPLALVIATFGCATTARPAGPPRMAVHQDTLDPALVTTFVDARIKWVQQLRAVGDSDLRGTYVQIGDHTFWSMYRFADWPDLSKHRAEAERRLKDVSQKDSDDYDRDSDRSLVFPHKSEIWVEKPELEYGAPKPDALIDANVAELVVENVRPTMSKQYWDAWPPIAKALESVKYPLQRVTYHSFYGTGQIYSFWIAPSETILKSAPPIGQALAVAVGAMKAGEMLQKWRDCVLATETHPVTVRHDMASPN